MPFLAETEKIPPPFSYSKAPLGRRYLAVLVDVFISAGPALTGVAFLVAAMSAISMVERSRIIAYAAMPMMLSGYLFMLVGVIWFLIYSFLKDAWRNGPSFGKRLCGLMVVDLKTNKPCTRRQSAIRAIGLFLPLTQTLDPILVLQDPEGRRVGDHLAGTQVIAAADYKPDFSTHCATATAAD